MKPNHDYIKRNSSSSNRLLAFIVKIHCHYVRMEIISTDITFIHIYTNLRSMAQEEP